MSLLILLRWRWCVLMFCSVSFVIIQMIATTSLEDDCAHRTLSIYTMVSPIQEETFNVLNIKQTNVPVII